MTAALSATRARRPVPWREGLLLALILVLAGCGSSPKPGSGGYYKDDGPHSRVPTNLDAVPDAVPRIEPLASGPNRPYVIFGKRYVPDTSGQAYRARGIASWYGRKFHGNQTSSGEIYDMYAMTAAHPTLPIPSYVRVTRTTTGRAVILRVNDRGPFHSDRIIDLSYVAAHKLGLIGPGSGEVVVELLRADDIRALQGGNAVAQAESVLPPAAARPVELASPRPMSTMPAGAAGLYLQLGAFGQAANAQALAQRVGTQTPPVRVEQHGALYRVRMGPYPDRDSALQAAEQLRRHTGLNPSLATP